MYSHNVLLNQMDAAVFSGDMVDHPSFADFLQRWQRQLDRPSSWVNPEIVELTTEGLIDILTKDRVRYTDCYYDKICDEWRHLTKCGTIIHLRPHIILYWMASPIAPAKPFTIEDL